MFEGPLAHLSQRTLLQNAKQVYEQAQKPLIAMVKADAYGHGAVEVAKRLSALSCVSHFGVVTLQEAIELREAGITNPILLMGGALGLEKPQALLDYDLIPCVGQMEALLALGGLKKPMRIHLDLDTGMGRTGFVMPLQLPEVLKTLSGFRLLEVQGVMTHLSAPAEDEAYSVAQLACFNAALQKLQEAGYNPSMIHVCSSAGILKGYDDPTYTHVRPGIALYEGVMTLKAPIVALKQLPKGFGVGYGHTFITHRETTEVAIVRLGYADGLKRLLSNQGYLWVAGQRCPILGRVSMDFVALEVTSMKPANHLLGDTATWIGPEQSVHEIALQCQTIAYEIYTSIGHRVKRIWSI